MPTELMETNKVEAVQNGTEQTRTNKVFIPRTDIYESKDHLLLMADMPGVKQDAVDITLEHNILTIYGRVEPPKVEEFGLTYAEYGIGDYRRVFTLSNEIDRDGIQASVKNGVLKLVLPKSKNAIPRKITVQTA
ncbi:MAG: Hsp20/alpha crystallin family protein [Candidatus Obscuribacterales bacterium]|nr:Hsp20/alpha crystallin family protein [Candidatus Obscuribacterales bacterium]